MDNRKVWRITKSFYITASLRINGKVFVIGVMLIWEADLHPHAAASDFRKEICIDIGVGNDIDRLLRLNGFIRHITRKRMVLIIQQVIINEDPFPNIRTVPNGRTPDEFCLPDLLPDSIRSPFMF